MTADAAEIAPSAFDPSNGYALAARPRFPRWAIVLIVPLVLFALLLVVVSVLLLLAVPVPVLPPLAPQNSLSTADVVALLTGGLTGLLAVGTFVLAAFTWQAVSAGLAETQVAQETLRQAQRQVVIASDQVTATNHQAEVAQATLEASWRPFLTDVSPGQYVERFALFDSAVAGNDYGQVRVSSDATRPETVCEVSFRNIGSGPAIIKGVGISGGGVGWNVDSMTRAIVARGELTSMTFKIPHQREDLAPLVGAINQAQPLEAEVSYVDQGGRNLWRTKLLLHKSPQDEWSVRQVAWYNGLESEPFAMSAPV